MAIRWRRVLLLAGVSVLCGVSYLAGVWYGTQAKLTCTVTSAQVIRCDADPSALPPGLPAPSTSRSGRA